MAAGRGLLVADKPTFEAKRPRHIAVVDHESLSELPPDIVTCPFLPKRIVRLFAITRPERPSLLAREFADRIARLAVGVVR